MSDLKAIQTEDALRFWAKRQGHWMVQRMTADYQMPTIREYEGHITVQAAQLDSLKAQVAALVEALRSAEPWIMADERYWANVPREGLDALQRLGSATDSLSASAATYKAEIERAAVEAATERFLNELPILFHIARDHPGETCENCEGVKDVDRDEARSCDVWFGHESETER